MLDTVNNFKQSHTFNSVSGTLVKSTPESRFTRFHIDSPMAKSAFGLDYPNLNDKKINVLQVMLCANEIVMVEYEYV